MRDGRVLAQRNFRCVQTEGVCQDLRFKRASTLRAAQHARDLRKNKAVRAITGPTIGTRTPARSGVEDAEEFTRGESVHRLEPERFAQNHGLCLVPSRQKSSYSF